MLGLIVLAACTVLMYRMAEMSDRSGGVWGGITFVICLACGLLIPLPLINIVIGLVISYIVFAATAIIQQRS